MCRTPSVVMQINPPGDPGGEGCFILQLHRLSLGNVFSSDRAVASFAPERPPPHHQITSSAERSDGGRGLEYLTREFGTHVSSEVVDGLEGLLQKSDLARRQTARVNEAGKRAAALVVSDLLAQL